MNNLIRNNVRKSILDVFGFFAKPANGIHILNGHMISRTNPNIDVFVSQLNELQKITTLVKIEDAIELISNKKIINDKLVAFTFDDGFEECSTMIAPALEQFGINGLFFINPNFVDGDEDYIQNFSKNVVLSPGKRPMRWNQIIDLYKSGHKIGSHTLDHYMICDNNVEEITRQIVGCKSVIEEKIKSDCPYFAFPFGRLEHANFPSIEIAVKHYKYVFSQSDYKNYFSFNGLVINRRHFEPDWPTNHIKYFISHKKKY